NQAVNTAPEVNNLKCAQAFLDNCISYLEAYAILLESERSDRQFIALPKYSTRREIGKLLKWDKEHDDRGLLTMLLEPGELTKPQPLEKPSQPWHLYTNNLPSEIQDKASNVGDRVLNALDNVHIFYYKPHDWLPALRVEVAATIAKNNNRLAIVLRGIKDQCATGAMLEPYPIYLADRMVKSLARALPAFRQVATQRISEKYEGDIGEVFFAMHGYRTESGV
ncbi:MAG: DNA double-strand break repair nuclease NurA, partial [Thermodesulfobacteriota bacterium]